MVRAVVGTPPAGQYIVADVAALNGLAQVLADYEQAKATLRANGWGDFGTSLVDVVNMIPGRVRNV